MSDEPTLPIKHEAYTKVIRPFSRLFLGCLVLFAALGVLCLHFGISHKDSQGQPQSPFDPHPFQVVEFRAFGIKQELLRWPAAEYNRPVLDDRIIQHMYEAPK
jgi:hypothetical protein